MAMNTYVDVMISEIECLIGRKLTETEHGTMEWLSGWEDETKTRIMRMMKAAYECGLRK